MPGQVSHGGWRRHMRICRNVAAAEYGDVPGAPSWQYLPIVGDGMKLKATSPRYVSDINMGGLRRRVAIHHQQVVEGDISWQPWPEITQYMLDMALLRVGAAGENYQDIYGHVIDFYTPVDPRRYRGVVVDSMSISASGTGDGTVSGTHSCIARIEQENDAIDEDDFDYSGLTLVPFMHWQSRLEVDDVLVTDVDSWTLTVENNVERGPLQPLAGASVGTIAYAIAGRRTISLELTKLDNMDRFNEAIRDGALLSFTARFVHPSGHNWEIQLPRLYSEENDEDGSPSQQAKQNPRMEAICGPDDDNDIIYGVDLGPTTSTLADITTTAVPV